MSNDESGCQADDCCNGDIPVYTHMIVDAGAIACNVDINNGDSHVVSTDLEKVDCEECRLKWLEYVYEQQVRVIADQKKVIEEHADNLRFARMQNETFRTAKLERDQIIRDLRRELANQNGANRRLVIERDRLRGDLTYLRRQAQGPAYYEYPKY